MALDIESLVAALSEEAPSGPDLSYDSERQEIETVFDRSVSGDEAAGDSQAWRTAITQIIEQSEKTRDLWLPTYLMRAAANSGDFGLTVEAAELFARMLEERWPDVHPQLDEYGYIGRKTPCESLTRMTEFIGPLGRLPLLVHPRLGQFAGNDFEVFRDQGSNAPDYGRFRAVVDATEAAELSLIVERLDTLSGAIKRADSILTANADGDTATNFAPTYEAIARIRNAVIQTVPALSAAAAPEAAPEQTSAPGVPAPAQSSGAAFTGGVGSREDAARALDAVIDYFSRAEPSSPVPALLRRAKEWISLDFLAILEEIAPGSMSEANRILKSGRSASVSSGYGGEPTPPPAAQVDDSWG